MREIKFRGKRLEDGEWVFGSLTQSQDSYYISNSNVRERDQWAFTYEVDPETVGQYTGLTDKNGKEIYEGDRFKIKRIRSKGFHCSGGSYDRQEDEFFEGIIGFDNGSFTASCDVYPFDRYLCNWQTRYSDDLKGSFLSGLSVNEERIGGNDSSEYIDFEKIGNIHSNPELL